MSGPEAGSYCLCASATTTARTGAGRGRSGYRPKPRTAPAARLPPENVDRVVLGRMVVTEVARA